MRAEHPIWRKDIVGLLEADIPEGYIAEFLGLNWTAPKPTPEPEPDDVGEEEEPSDVSEKTSEPQTALLPQRPRRKPQRFLLPVYTRFLKPIPEEPSHRPTPISALELKADLDQVGLPLQPLCLWPRLGPQLRRRLTRDVAGKALDLRRTIHHVCRGIPLVGLPRKVRRPWTRELVVIWDQSESMDPFQEDVFHLLDCFRRVMGSAAVHLVKLETLRGSRPPPLPADAPVLLLSTMGFHTPEPERPEEPESAPGEIPRPLPACPWRHLAHTLQQQGHAIHALVPLPRSWWTRERASAWPLLEWSPQLHVPRRGGQGPLERAHAPATVKELLLLLAAASRVSPQLARAVRRLQGPTADAGTEALAWRHPEVHAWGRAFAFEPTANERRLAIRKQSGASPRGHLIEAADELIEADHALLGRAISLESKLRRALAGSQSLEDTRDVLDTVVERLRLLASSDLDESTWNGLVTWFSGMVGRLNADIRSDPRIEKLIARGLACADVKEGITPRELPEGIDQTEYLKEKRRIKPVNPIGTYAVHLAPDGLAVKPLASPGEASRELYRLLIDPNPMFVRGVPGQVDGMDAEKEAEQNPSVSYAYRAPRLDIPLPARIEDPIWISSSHQEILLMPVERPSWARRMGLDAFGSWSELQVGSVVVKLRWIPPGRFGMGDEGEKKQTVVEHGFWMADTLCTQHLWTEVMGKNPSLFKPGRVKQATRFFRRNAPLPPEYRHPVENVTWAKCQTFFAKIAERVPNLDVGFPTEVQWEYACRAGTESNFHNGRDAGLEDLGWFGGNSGETTHPVGLKQPNAWGLYDMHGNVWELCAGWFDAHRVARVVRGGSWLNPARYCRSASRNWGDPGIRPRHQGFRLLAGQKQDQGPEAKGSGTSGARGTSPESVIRLWSANAALPGEVATRQRWVPTWATDSGEDKVGRWASVAVEGVAFRFRWIDTGSFWMGSRDDEPEAYGDEQPRHQVTLTQGFWLAEVPTTQAQWMALMGENPSHFKGEDRPVEQVSWEDCQRLIGRLNEPLGLGADLPTEAEWEYACRAGTESAYNNGRDDGLEDLGWFKGNSGGQTHPVKQKPANAWGLHDMHGNVWEWCQDGKRSYTSESVVNPVGPTKEGVDRVVRGGCWDGPAGRCRSAYRIWGDPGDRGRSLGFRLLAGRKQDQERAGVPEAQS